MQEMMPKMMVEMMW
jgi:hypothetical protein